MIDEQKNDNSDTKRRSYYWYGGMVPGIYLLLVGGLFLLNNFGYLQGQAWGKLWPLFMIVPGLLMIFRPRIGKW
jgi:hypothetical protein